MEVQHHAHTARKKWTHYFWEFFMLFLAVTLGFFVENQREHLIEHKREKQYLRSLYNDLKADTIFINFFSQYGLNLEDSTLQKQMDLVSSGRYITESKPFYLAALATVSVLYFEYHNSTFEQLKSSGSLRLLRNRELAKKLTEYDNFIHEVLKKYEARHLEVNARLSAYQWQVLDVSYYKKRADHGSSSSARINSFVVDTTPVFKEDDKVKMKQLNSLYFEKRTMYPSYHEMMQAAKDMALGLLRVIKDDEGFE